MSLDAKTVLVRAGELTVHLSDSDRVNIDLDGERITAPPVALAVLDAFATPRPVGEVLDQLAARGAEHFVEASSVVVQLAEAGVLRSDRGAARVRGYVRPSIHIAMLDDRARTKAFCDAIAKVVAPEDVVVEIGVGTGVLSAKAALRGAKRVYGIESSGIADLAARVLEANGVGDRVTIVRGRSTQVTLPERGTVLVTEMIGNDPLDEDILEIVGDAKRRLLAPGARLVPSSIEIWAVLVDVPRELFEAHAFTPERIDAYRAAYGIELAPVLAHRLTPAQPIMVKTEAARAWPRVAEPIRLAAIDFTANEIPVTLEQRARATITAPARSLGLLLTFRSTLADGIVLSTLPAEVDPTNHWRCALWPAFDRAAVAAGDVVDIAYAYAAGKTSVRLA